MLPIAKRDSSARAGCRRLISGGLLLGAAALAFGTLPGCEAGNGKLPAAKAFALSASALSGRDRYGFDGELKLFDPSGMAVISSRYAGEVTDHGKTTLQWKGDTARPISAAADFPDGYDPLALLHAIDGRTARVAYADPAYLDGRVALRVTLDEKTARKRVEDGLRAEMRGVRSEAESRIREPEARRRAEAVLDEADAKLEQALASLRVTTECLWEADRKNWFPRRMTEKTALTYTWDGKPCRETRTSVTNFLPGGQSGTMGKDSGR